MITASVVLYNTDVSQLCSVVNSYVPSAERILYLIDNSKQEFDLSKLDIDLTHIKYIFNNKNLGYGAAHNIALHEALGINSEYHIVLNPDIKFDNKVLYDLKLFMNNNHDAVYILPKVIYPSGELQYLCKLLPTPFDLFIRRFLPSFAFSKKMNDRYVLKNSGYNKIINPPCLSGCFMFLRLDTIKQYNIFFDERFFMYFEDFDLIRRLHRVGKTVFYPYVTIIHDHAHASYKSKKMLKLHVISAIKYFNKYGWFFDKERKNMNGIILKEIQE
nr:glycosyltransferase family 2 protein [uncultured Treponema sp.]